MQKIEPPRKLLIIKPSALGDIVHSLPFLHAVKKCFPHCRVHWVVAYGLHRFLENHPLIDRLWIFRKEEWKRLSRLPRSLGEIASFAAGLRRERFDVSVDLSGLLRSGLITRAAGAAVRLGFAGADEGSPFFYTHKVHGSMKIHAIDRYLEIAEFMGCRVDEIVYPFAPFPEHPPICDRLPDHYVVMSPSAGKEANRWPAERFGELAARLPLPSVMISGPGDAHVVQKAVAASGGKGIDLAGKTSLAELVAVIRRARYFVTNDTGPMHIAAASGVPVFAIFGPANPVRTGPYGEIHTVIREEVECSPCYRWKPCDNWQCMEKITVERVYEAIDTKMGAGSGRD